jgi:hypothetical protein
MQASALELPRCSTAMDSSQNTADGLRLTSVKMPAAPKVRGIGPVSRLRVMLNTRSCPNMPATLGRPPLQPNSANVCSLSVRMLDISCTSGGHYTCPKLQGAAREITTGPHRKRLWSICRITRSGSSGRVIGKVLCTTQHTSCLSTGAASHSWLPLQPHQGWHAPRINVASHSVFHPPLYGAIRCAPQTGCC